MKAITYHVFRRKADDPNFYAITKNGQIGLGAAGEPRAEFETWSLFTAASDAIKLCAEKGNPVRDGETLLVQCITGGIAVFQAKTSVTTVDRIKI